MQQNYAHARKDCNKYDLPRLLLDSNLPPCSLCINFILEFLLALLCNLIHYNFHQSCLWFHPTCVSLCRSVLKRQCEVLYVQN